MNARLKAHLAVLIGNFFFGSCVVAVKQIVPVVMPSLALNVLRVSVALGLFWIMYLMKPSKAGIQKKHIGLFIICAASGVAINQILYIKGASLTSPIHTSLLSLATPIAITIMAAFIFKEKITANKGLGLLLGIGGAALLIFSRSAADKSATLLGDTLIVLNATSYAAYLIMAKPLMDSYTPIHVIRWVFMFGALMIVPIGWSDFQQVHWQQFEWHHWMSLGFIVFGATFIAYLCMVYGIATLGSTITGMYIYTQPVFATIASMLLFGEGLSLVKLAAAALIFSGVYLVNRKKKLTTPEAMEVVE